MFFLPVLLSVGSVIATFGQSALPDSDAIANALDNTELVWPPQSSDTKMPCSTTAKTSYISPLVFQLKCNQAPILDATNAASTTATNNLGSNCVRVSSGTNSVVSGDTHSNFNLGIAVGQPDWIWIDDPVYPLIIETTNSRDGCALLAYGDSVSLRSTINGPGILSFYMWINPYIDGYLYDGNEKLFHRKDYTQFGWYQGSVYLGKGSHSLKWNWICDLNYTLFTEKTLPTQLGFLDTVDFVPIAVAPILIIQPSSQTNIAGNTVTLNSIGGGDHVLAWTFYPVYGYSAAGTAWLDQINTTSGGVGPAFTTQPTNGSVLAGKSLTLSSSATGTSPLFYQWQYNGVDIPNATNTTLSFSNIQAEVAGIYAVTVTNQFGTVTSSNVTVIVLPSAPILTKSPTSQAINIRGAINLYAGATGTAPLTIQWSHDDTPIADATNAMLTLTNMQYADSGNYSAVFSNPLGVATSVVAKVEVAATVARDCYWLNFIPLGHLGETNLVSVAAGGGFTLGLRKDGTVAVWGNGAGTNVPNGLSNVVAIAAGLDHAVALKNDGTVVVWGDNRRDQLNIPAGLTNIVSISAIANFTLALKEDGTILAWGKNTLSWPVYSNFASNVDTICAADGENFTLKEDGSVSSWTNGPTISGNTLSSDITAHMTGVDGIVDSFLYTWTLQDDGTLQAFCSAPLPLNTNSILRIGSSGSKHYRQPITLKSDGTLNWVDFAKYYSIDIEPKGTFDFSVYNFHLVLLQGDGSPHVVSGRHARSAKPGDKISISSRIVGDSPMSYQWSRNGTVLGNATNCFLNIPVVTSSDAGVYSCIGSNAFGMVTNQSCTLKVISSSPVLSLKANRVDGTINVGIHLVDGIKEVVVFTSTDLVNWTPVWTNIPDTTETHFVETLDQGTRFYRVEAR